MKRILSIDICNRGVGFVVLESPGRLVDWGVKQSSTASDGSEVSRVDALLRLYHPHILVTEDVASPACRRGVRAKRLTEAVQDFAARLEIPVYRCDPRTVRKVFAASGATNKYRIAAAVGLEYPTLIRHLPPPRKPWMSEDPRMAIFDAASFAMTYLREHHFTPTTRANS